MIPAAIIVAICLIREMVMEIKGELDG